MATTDRSFEINPLFRSHCGRVVIQAASIKALSNGKPQIKYLMVGGQLVMFPWHSDLCQPCFPMELEPKNCKQLGLMHIIPDVPFEEHEKQTL